MILRIILGSIIIVAGTRTRPKNIFAVTAGCDRKIQSAVRHRSVRGSKLQVQQQQ